MWFTVKSVNLAPPVVAGIVIGGGVVLIFITVLCVCLCCRRRNGKDRKITAQNINLENPPDQSKGQYSPAPSDRSRAASQHPPRQSSKSSTATNNSSLPKQESRHSQQPYSNISDSEVSVQSHASLTQSRGSSIPPPSPALSVGSSQIMFTYEELAMATNAFSEANLLGQGGFGYVHKGALPNGKEIAVKSLKANSGQGDREFRAEVEIISRVHHRHLVSLVGYCILDSQRLLVYEFVPNKTLDCHLHGKEPAGMDWATRLKVAIGAAKGLAYLHEDCHPRIIHRDIKAANILLDNQFQAKVADFGLARSAGEADTHISTRVMGTLGYMAPEYASSGKLTDKSDIYSFGVMLLELITGRKPVDRTQKEYNLVEWAKPLLIKALEDENFNNLVDPRLQYCYKHSEMARMVSCAATCVRKSAKRRPLMSQVVRALEGNISLNDLNEGITPGRSIVNRYDSNNSEYSDTKYNKASRGYQTTTSEYSGSTGYSTGLQTSELDGTTSEYGLYASSSSSEGQTTRELNTDEINRAKRPNYHRRL